MTTPRERHRQRLEHHINHTVIAGRVVKVRCRYKHPTTGRFVLRFLLATKRSNRNGFLWTDFIYNEVAVKGDMALYCSPFIEHGAAVNVIGKIDTGYAVHPKYPNKRYPKTIIMAAQVTPCPQNYNYAGTPRSVMVDEIEPGKGDDTMIVISEDIPEVISELLLPEDLKMKDMEWMDEDVIMPGEE